MNLVLFGPPGAGKGTQSQLLIEKKKLGHISTGDLFRAAIKNKTPLGVQAKGFLDRGELVPDEITIGLVSETLDRLEGRDFVLDGFPRNIVQAESLEKLLTQKKKSIQRAIFFRVPDNIVVERLSGRRVCTQCGTTFHVATKPPKVAGKCDVCGGQVTQRNDDQEAAIRERLRIYHTNTQPLFDFYSRMKKAVEVDGLGDVEDVYKRVDSTL